MFLPQKNKTKLEFPDECLEGEGGLGVGGLGFLSFAP